jgi:hypothetical protein
MPVKGLTVNRGKALRPVKPTIYYGFFIEVPEEVWWNRLAGIVSPR